jgi:DNA mismatch repair ATPase MutS
MKEEEFSLYSKIIGYKDVNLRKSKSIKSGVLSFPLFDGLIETIEKENYEMFKNLENVGKRVEQFELIYKTFLDFDVELDFYDSALNLKNLLDSLDLPCCVPSVYEVNQEQLIDLKEFYDLTTVMLMNEEKRNTTSIVTNDVLLKDNERIVILTGPNQGGKTTWIRGLGLCQVLFQAGFFLPASKASLSVKDFIFTHFPADEKLILSKGRMGEEVLRLKNVFSNLSSRSMFLMNESFSSTNAIDGINILSGILQALRSIGVTMALATHLHELVEQLDEINSEPAITNAIHMVACTESDLSCDKSKSSTKRTYKVFRNISGSGSFAMDIAKMCGADPDNIRKLISDKYSDTPEGVSL